MVCFFHRSTGEILCHPDPDDLYFEPEPWQELIDKVNADEENFTAFEKMNSTESFRIMEDFADSISDIDDRSKALERLARRKPFSHFKAYIESSHYREAWFALRRQAYAEFVRRQVENE
jgi:hypothetical protein